MLWLTAGGRLLLCESGGSLSAADSLERPALTIPFLKYVAGKDGLLLPAGSIPEVASA